MNKKAKKWTQDDVDKLVAGKLIKSYNVIGGGSQAAGAVNGGADGQAVSHTATGLKQGSPARNKYGNKKVYYQDTGFDSELERDRFIVLSAYLASGVITDLKLQTSYDLTVNGFLICRYVADFDYYRAGVHVVEDTKSEITRKNRAYRIKHKLMLAIHGVKIQEILKSV